MRQMIFSFDDNVESHIKIVAPILVNYKFTATFFVTNRSDLWERHRILGRGYSEEIANKTWEKALTHEEIVKLDQLGFEIGNHTWTHPNLTQSENPHEEIRKLNELLDQLGIQKPTSFAYPGYYHSSNLSSILKQHKICFARSGYLQYGCPEYYTDKTHPHAIFVTGIFNGSYTFEKFTDSLNMAPKNSIPVFVFHGLRSRELIFEQCVQYANENNWKITSFRNSVISYI